MYFYLLKIFSATCLIRNRIQSDINNNVHKSSIKASNILSDFSETWSFETESPKKRKF